MDVSVKLVVFYHHGQGKYCSYSPELKCFNARAATVAEVIHLFTHEYLLWELENRFYAVNLYKRSWEITEDSVIPPTFTDEEAVKLTEKSYEIKIKEYQIEVINVKVPPPVGRRNLPGFYEYTGNIPKG